MITAFLNVACSESEELKFKGIERSITLGLSRDQIEPELQIHVYEFLRQAEKRHINLKSHRFKIKFQKLPQGTAGKTYNNKPFLIDDIILIDPEQGKAFFENVVFHEMGHLYLGRGHDNTQYAHGTKSIMNGKAYIPNYMPQDTTINNIHREYYIDELFNSGTPEPDFLK